MSVRSGNHLMSRPYTGQKRRSSALCPTASDDASESCRDASKSTADRTASGPDATGSRDHAVWSRSDDARSNGDASWSSLDASSSNADREPSRLDAARLALDLVPFGVACPASRAEPSSSPADAMGNDDDRDPKAATRAAWRSFLSRKDVYAWVQSHVAAKVDAYNAPEVAGDALTEAIRATALPDSDEEGVLWAWLRTIVDRGVADFHEKRATRKKYEGNMPRAPVKVDEAGEPVDTTYDDDVEDRDPSSDPRAPDRRVEGFLLRQYLKQAVKGNARDEETLSWILQWTDEGKGYQEIADAAGVSRAKVEARVHRFKHKYFARYEKWRDRAVVFLVLLGAVLLLVLLAWLLNRPKAVEQPTQEPAPVPADAATVLAPLPDFDNAWPTQPGDAGGPKPPKPPVVP